MQTSSFRGGAQASSPESITTNANVARSRGRSANHNRHRWLWIPGSRVARPGMTTRERAAAKWHDGQDCASHRPQISGLRSPVPFRQEGRIAIVTNAGRDVVDARASARQGVAGRVLKGPVSGSRRRATTNDVSSVRQNRVVLTPVAGAKSAVTGLTRPGRSVARVRR